MGRSIGKLGGLQPVEIGKLGVWVAGFAGRACGDCKAWGLGCRDWKAGGVGLQVSLDVPVEIGKQGGWVAEIGKLEVWVAGFPGRACGDSGGGHPGRSRLSALGDGLRPVRVQRRPDVERLQRQRQPCGTSMTSTRPLVTHQPCETQNEGIKAVKAKT